MNLVRTIGEPVRVSADLVLTVVGVEGPQVRLRLSTPQGALMGAPVLAGRSSALHLRVAVGTSLAVAERALIEATLKSCAGRRAKPRAAALLGCSLKTLYNKLHHYGLMDRVVSPLKTTPRAHRPGRHTGPRAESERPVEAAP